MAITAGTGTAASLVPWLRALGAAGLEVVVIREPDLPYGALDEVLDAAVAAIPTVVVHDRNPHARELCRERGLTVHLTAGTPPPDGLAFAASTHDPAEVDAALAAGARYALLSPVWAPLSKPTDHRRPLGPDRYLEIAGERPVYALGGITAARYGALVERGAPGAAVLAAVAGPPATAARALRKLLR